MKLTVSTFVLLVIMATAQAQHQHDMGSMNHDDMANMPGMELTSSDASSEEQMAHHLDMGPHMKMTTLRTANQADKDRAALAVATTRDALEKYKDYKVALNDGFKIFHPEIPTKMKHFTSYSNAWANSVGWDPSKPTSLLYEDEGNGDYKLIEAMYTASKRMAEDDLDKRVPLSIAQWHAHVNICMPPKGQDRGQWRQMFSKDAKFGLGGSISTQEACDAAGGRFFPQIFGWMLHVYPWEKGLDKQFSLEPQHEQMEHMKH